MKAFHGSRCMFFLVPSPASPHPLSRRGQRFRLTGHHNLIEAFIWTLEWLFIILQLFLCFCKLNFLSIVTWLVLGFNRADTVWVEANIDRGYGPVVVPERIGLGCQVSAGIPVPSRTWDDTHLRNSKEESAWKAKLRLLSCLCTDLSTEHAHNAQSCYNVSLSWAQVKVSGCIVHAYFDAL